MREIKFRGRDEYGKWHYGAFMGVFHDGVVAPIEYANIYDDGMATRVLPNTVGQFTGLNDCKGQEIFEGDILFVKAENPYWSKFDNKYVVTWCNDGWILNDYGTDDPGLFNILMNSDCDCEIIGNVHDNPGLLR